MPMIDGRYRRPQLRNGKINYRFGWFFVTFQVFENKSLLGAIVGENCILNELGLAVKGLIETLPKYNPEVYVDCFVVMPNHVHLILKIDDRPTNEEHHLGKIMRKLKSLAAREYRLLGSRGMFLGRGGVTPRTKLWQDNYWEKIVTSHEQLEAIRRYIENNPRHWSTDRFGPVTTFSCGNLALLDEPFVAFVASQVARGDALAPREWARHNGLAPQDDARGDALVPRDEARHDGLAPQDWKALGERGCDPPPVISTFTSPQEREALRRLLSKKRRIIAVYPGGIPAVLPPAIAESVDAGRMLLLSPVESGTGVNKQRAIWCNEYVIRRAKKVWCGTIAPGGTLESILKGVSK